MMLLSDAREMISFYGGNDDDKYVWTKGDGNDFISDWHGNNLIKLVDVKRDDVDLSMKNIEGVGYY